MERPVGAGVGFMGAGIMDATAAPPTRGDPASAAGRCVAVHDAVRTNTREPQTGHLKAYKSCGE